MTFIERVNAYSNLTTFGCQGISQHFYAVIISTHVCVIIGLQASLKPAQDESEHRVKPLEEQESVRSEGHRKV